MDTSSYLNSTEKGVSKSYEQREAKISVNSRTRSGLKERLLPLLASFLLSLFNDNVVGAH